ncbi:MAG: dihydrolipoyl dehydrogenase [Holosporales bacterium]|jgi:dihydrolipoamide dehydrogenase|nr:dihydrolipoyl dehydrogenase [Holosporales bacterium]
MTNDFDVAIIGSGPGGYAAAIRASQLGLRTAIIEAEKLGGTCLNCGCIPTKTLLQTAKVKKLVDRSSEFGIDASVKSFNLRRLVERAEDVISGLHSGVANMLTDLGVTVIRGYASFLDKNTLSIKNGRELSKITATNIIIATGAKPRMLPEIDESLIMRGLVWASREAIRPKIIPKKILVVGSGVIGVEIATFYNAVGSDVTIAEIQNRILAGEDSEISDFARKAFVSSGISVLLGTKSQNFRSTKVGEVTVDLIGPDGTCRTRAFDVAIIAVGVSPNISELNLDKAGVTLTRNGTITVFDGQETSQKGIYAIGDVTDPPWIAHKATREGIICAERIAGLSTMPPIDSKKIPSCTYSIPQVASIGMTEAEAKGRDVRIGKSYFKGNGKAVTLGETDGFVKVIFDNQTGELLGAHMVGYEVTELISAFSVAIAGELTDRELLAVVFPHPTMSECLQEAIAAASAGIGTVGK